MHVCHVCMYACMYYNILLLIFIQASRDLKRACDRAEYDSARYRDRAIDLEAKAHEDMLRISKLEKEALSLQEEIYKRDRLLSQEKHRSAGFDQSLIDIREQFSKESDLLHAKVSLLYSYFSHNHIDVFKCFTVYTHTYTYT